MLYLEEEEIEMGDIEEMEATEAVPQLILTPFFSLLFGFRALYTFLFLVILDCWTASTEDKKAR